MVLVVIEGWVFLFGYCLPLSWQVTFVLRSKLSPHFRPLTAVITYLMGYRYWWKIAKKQIQKSICSGDQIQ